jgi:hypothetical protein
MRTDRIVVVAPLVCLRDGARGEILDQPDFYNAVIAVETDLPPRELLDACKQIEREQGRAEGGPDTPRGRSTSTCWSSRTSHCRRTGW